MNLNTFIMKKFITPIVFALLALSGCKQTSPTTEQTPPEINSQTAPLRTHKPIVRNQTIIQNHYMIIGSFQGRFNAPALSHTFAVFCRTNENNNIIESRTISWVPHTLNIKVFKFEPEPGTNLTYKQTYDIAAKNNNNLFFRGPYKIDPELYRRACEQATELESGKILFKANDISTRPRAINGTHAIADIDHENGYLITGASWGNAATSIVEKHLFRWVIQDKSDNAWVLNKIQSELGK